MMIIADFGFQISDFYSLSLLNQKSKITSTPILYVYLHVEFLPHQENMTLQDNKGF